tara:strand:+ start:1208 stop:2440 length:1233 start_codon:yes stop_codon:yes gene_type:complete
MDQLSSKLIEGAGKAVKSSGPVITRKQIKGLGRASSRLADSVNNYIKNQQKVKLEEKQYAYEEWGKAAEKYLSEAKGLGDVDREALFINLEADSEAFANTKLGRKGEQERNELFSKLQTMTNAVTSLSDTKDFLAKSIKNQDGLGALTDSFKTSMMGVDYIQWLNGGIPISQNEDGDWGAVLYNPQIKKDLLVKKERLENNLALLNVEDDGPEMLDINEQLQEINDFIEEGDLNPDSNRSWMSFQDIRNTIWENRFDMATSKALTTHANNIRVDALENGTNYNRDQGRYIARMMLSGDSVNYRSIVEDKHAGLEQSFEEALTDYLHSLTYDQLNINYSDIAAFDPDEAGDGSATISMADAEIITKKLTSSKEMAMPYIEIFFSNFFENQSIAGLKERKDKTALLNAEPID